MKKEKKQVTVAKPVNIQYDAILTSSHLKSSRLDCEPYCIFQKQLDGVDALYCRYFFFKRQ
eukprot:gene8217-814_t